MNSIRDVAMILSVLASLCSPAGAHMGDRVYPITYLSDEIIEEIRVDDGMVDEWFDLVGEPNLTILDFNETEKNSQFDPSDMDFRIWLAWHDDPVRIYAAFVGSDDLYKNNHDYSEDYLNRDVIWIHDSLGLAIDGDHSGGPSLGVNSNSTLEEREERLGKTQYYSAIARTARGPTMDNGTMRQATGVTWIAVPPFGNSGGSVFGEGPFISVIELYVTPFDQWEGWDRTGEIEASKLAPGKVIGFGITVFDYDSGEEWGQFWTPRRMPSLPGPDELVDGILLGPDGLSAPSEDSAVEMDSWARIKASLKVD